MVQMSVSYWQQYTKVDMTINYLQFISNICRTGVCVVLSVSSTIGISFVVQLTKFPTLPVIFSIYLKTDFLDFFEIL